MTNRSTSTDGESTSAERERTAPDPDAPGKPDSPGDIAKPTWGYSLRKAVREFMDDQCTDLAAALTYYAVLALFPALIALVSLLGLVGQGSRPCDTLLQILRDIGAVVGGRHPRADAATSSTRQPGRRARRWSSASLAALWSASGYVGAFGRGDEPDLRDRRGRPDLEAAPGHARSSPWSTVLLAALVALGLVVTRTGRRGRRQRDRARVDAP